LLATNKREEMPVFRDAGTTTFESLSLNSRFKVVKPDGNCGCVLVKISCGSAELKVNTTTRSYPFKGNETVVPVLE